jgi:hypothetical protein
LLGHRCRFLASESSRSTASLWDHRDHALCNEADATSVKFWMRLPTALALLAYCWASDQVDTRSCARTRFSCQMVHVQSHVLLFFSRSCTGISLIASSSMS